MTLLRSSCVLLTLACCDAKLDFFVMADWGGSETSPFTTDGELGCAKQMGTLKPVTDSQFVLAIGDNFYSHGVSNENDPRFENTFEKAFPSPNLQSKDFFRVVAGNHDHYGNVSAQLAYANKSPRWRFDSLYYSFTETIPASGDGDYDSTVEVVMIDTVLLAGNSDVVNEKGEITHSLKGSELPGPEDQAAADEEWAWLEFTLANSTAEYLIVAGHYPVYSICEHGPTPFMVNKLKPLLEKYHVSAYMAGHDHCAEYFSENGVEYHGMGATHALDPSTAHTGDVPAGVLKWHYLTTGPQTSHGAFGHVTVNSTGMAVTHINSAGEVLFKAPLIKPRAPVPPGPPTPVPTPVAPTPKPVPPAGMSWECHANEEFLNRKMKVELTDTDLQCMGDCSQATVAKCEDKCLETATCLVINWHAQDKHCHTLAGAITPAEYTGLLNHDGNYSTCMLVKAKA